jgi:predicted PurR-regulated permease PerM
VTALRWVVLALCAGSVVALAPLWAPLVLAIWTADLARPVHARLARMLAGRSRAGAVVTLVLVLLVVVPAVLLIVSLATSVAHLVSQLRSSQDKPEALSAILKDGSGLSLEALNGSQVAKLAERFGSGAWKALAVVASAAGGIVLGLFIYAVSVYSVLVDGDRAMAWVEKHAPLSPADLRRLASAFRETGRGLIIGVGLTAVAQGAAATIGYFALRVPQAALLGALTTVAAFIPSGGAGLVWLPVTAALALFGRPGAAIAMLVIGVVISTADNFLRPVLSRYGELSLPTYILLIAMLGGIAAFGTWGLFLGPLLVRLSIEGLSLLREHDALR